MPQPAPYQPLPVISGQSNYARKAWWRGFELTPGCVMKTTARLRPALAARCHDPKELLFSLAGAASAALTLHPRLNFYTFWGDMVWAGEPARVGVVLENPDQTCVTVSIAQAHALDKAAFAQALAQGRRARPLGSWERLRERWPLPCYLAERLSGHYRRAYTRHTPPLFISMLALPGIEDGSFTPAHSMLLAPAWPRDGLLPLSLCYNHQLAIRDLLE
jgi:hypothetical protein